MFNYNRDDCETCAFFEFLNKAKKDSNDDWWTVDRDEFVISYRGA